LRPTSTGSVFAGKQFFVFGRSAEVPTVARSVVPLQEASFALDALRELHFDVELLRGARRQIVSNVVLGVLQWEFENFEAVSVQTFLGHLFSLACGGAHFEGEEAPMIGCYVDCDGQFLSFFVSSTDNRVLGVDSIGQFVGSRAVPGVATDAALAAIGVPMSAETSAIKFVVIVVLGSLRVPVAPETRSSRRLLEASVRLAFLGKKTNPQKKTRYR